MYNFDWNLADLLVRQQKHAEASAAAEKLVERFPNRLQAYYEAADLLLRCAEVADAQSRSLRLGEGRGEGHSEEGRREAYRDTARRLIASADQETERTPDSLERFAWFLVTCRDKSFRDPAKALALADAGLAEAPQRAALHRMRGIALYRLGQYRPAIDAFNQSAAFLPGADVTDALFLAMAYWQIDHPSEAKKWYQSAIDWFATRQLKRPSAYDFISDAQSEILAEANEVFAANGRNATQSQ
jgi:tetratricopeptide (TPR) repeat protein